MARYERTYTGERMTESLRIHVPPSLRAKLKAAAEQVGAQSFNQFMNELLADQVHVTVAGVRRNPEANAIIQALDAGTHANNAIGNNLNQLMRYLHSTGGTAQDIEYVRAVLARIDKAIEQYIAAQERVLAL